MTNRDLFDKSNLDILFSNVLRFRSSKYFRELLEMCRKFRHLSPYNAMLVNLQKPMAKWVLREKEWQDQFNRNLKPNAQPLIILVPFGPVDYLFEIGDTESGNGLFPERDQDILDFIARPYQTKNDVSEDVLIRVQERCALHGIAFDMQMNAGVDYGAKIELLTNPRNNKKVPIKKDHFMDLDAPYLISVNKNAGRGEQMASIVHELGHLFCRHLSAPDGWKPWQPRLLNHKVKEFEAESVAWLICERLNIGNPSEAYLAKYLDKNDTIPQHVSIEAIFHAFNTIWDLCRGDKSFSYKEGIMYQNDQRFKALMDKITQKGQKSQGRTPRVF